MKDAIAENRCRKCAVKLTLHSKWDYCQPCRTFECPDCRIIQKWRDQPRTICFDCERKRTRKEAKGL
jgi:hypothetical protein